MSDGMVLGPRNGRRLIRLLGLLQDNLESAIKSCLVGDVVHEPFKGLVRLERKRWREAEDMIALLSPKPRSRRRAP
jgi:hypothetical protein